MGKQKKKIKLKASTEVLKMPPDEARKYILDNATLIHEEYSQEELVSVFSYGHSNLYKVGEATANRRQAWTVNHVYIIGAICDMLKDQGRIPSITEISAKTKLSRVTVTRHLKHFEKEEYLQLHLQKWKLVTEKILVKMSKYVLSEYVGYKDSIRAASVYLKFADKFLNPVKESQPINNFIQINKIYITQETIKALPEYKREKLEALILESNETKLG